MKKQMMLVGCLPFLILAATWAEESCFNAKCHVEFSKINAWHEPAEDDCGTCHELIDEKEHRFEFVDRLDVMCADCHDDKTSDAVVHGPVASGECTECHNPHGADTKAFLKFPSQDQLCYSCHDVQYKEKRYLHGPIGPGRCTTCHQPHSAAFRFLLPGPPQELCVDCHTDRQFGGEGMNLHTEVEDNGCSGCHDTHASDFPFQLLEEPSELCAACHDDVVGNAKKANFPHKPIGEGARCQNCHNPHGSPFEFNLDKDPLALCLGCHDKPILASNGEDFNIAKTLKRNPNHHGPLQDGNCSGCHNPHGSPYYMLLINDFPKTFYIPFAEEAYALCFDCHDKELVRQKNTKVDTGFRDGDQNLHYLHVHMEKKGRTCRSCHRIHASNQIRHIREEVPFGKWSLPIGFSPQPDGGSCAPGCHKPKVYRR